MVQKFLRMTALSAVLAMSVSAITVSSSIASAGMCSELFADWQNVATLQRDQFGVLHRDITKGRMILSVGHLQGSMTENGKTFLTLLLNESSGLHNYESSSLFRAIEPVRAHATVIDMNNPNPLMESHIVTLIGVRNFNGREEHIARRADGKLVQVWYYNLLDAPAAGELNPAGTP